MKYLIKVLCVLCVLLFITSCSVKYKYHELHLSNNIYTEDIINMNYEIGALLTKHIYKYDDNALSEKDKEENKKNINYHQFEDKDKQTIVVSLTNHLNNKFYQSKKPSGNKTMIINLLTDTKCYSKIGLCRTCRRYSGCYTYECMKSFYDVKTYIIGLDKQDTSKVLYKYKIKFTQESEDQRYQKADIPLNEILQFQIQQFVEDLVEENDG